MNAPLAALHLFEGYGIELEYMIVDKDTLAVHPIADQVLFEAGGSAENEVERDDLRWSNELVLHVIEIKTNGPAYSYVGLEKSFSRGIFEINQSLGRHGAMLMPTAMHPWMEPEREMRLWPHGNKEIYEAYNRIFSCRGHGWSNLQSMHINLPFSGPVEFGKLHAAIRLVLPLLPALAASSPIVEGQLTGLSDNRLEVYRFNQRKVPAITGHVVPEAVFTPQDYEREILQRLYRDIAPHDPSGLLQEEWLNSRGAIARFDRNAIEIRVLDIQECPRADIAIAAATVAIVKALCDESIAPFTKQTSWPVEPLAAMFVDTVRDGEAAVINDRAYLDLFGYPNERSASARDLWQHIIETLAARNAPELSAYRDTLRFILQNGPLSRRIARSLRGSVTRERINAVYRELCACLAEDRLYTGLA